MTAAIQPTTTDGLAEAYRLAAYFVDIDSEIIEIAVGYPALRLETQLARADTFAYITACNPASQLQPEAWNQRADRELRAAIDHHGYLRWPMNSSSPDGQWWEAGWLVGDVPPALLDEWARHFGQRGTLLWRRGGPVRLRMYGPAEFPHPQIDWIE
ncbi:MAG: DUF3293 domain-containing protein [Proteobacteria bacterium]|nr:DUF3293 domain-containing protein [Pseudomonadota bacterium]